MKRGPGSFLPRFIKWSLETDSRHGNNFIEKTCSSTIDDKISIMKTFGFPWWFIPCGRDFLNTFNGKQACIISVRVITMIIFPVSVLVTLPVHYSLPCLILSWHLPLFVYAGFPTRVNLPSVIRWGMMTSSNGNILRVTRLLALCARNSPVTGEFRTQRPVTRSLDVSFDLRLNKYLSKQWRRRWVQTSSRSLWRHCDGVSPRRPLLEYLLSLCRVTAMPEDATHK